ncbi:MAG TPA: double zinc ribbon domain-containing protein [Methylovirgula sp.]|nr:double zinc ribbon domain-containing protein [Methylovirgula sp.]
MPIPSPRQPPSSARGAGGLSRPALTGSARPPSTSFPRCCLACRKATAGHGALCPACWGRIHFMTGPIAKGSARLFPMISASRACIRPRRSPTRRPMAAPAPSPGSRRGRRGPWCIA